MVIDVLLHLAPTVAAEVRFLATFLSIDLSDIDGDSAFQDQFSTTTAAAAGVVVSQVCETLWNLHVFQMSSSSNVIMCIILLMSCRCCL